MSPSKQHSRASATVTNKNPKDTELPVLPPCDILAETSALGALMLLDGDVVATGAKLLDPGDFYRDANSEIFRAMLDLHRRGAGVDVVNLQAELKTRGTLDEVGGIAYLMQLAEFVPTTVNLPHYAQIVKEKAARRFIIESSARIAGMARADDVPVSETLAALQNTHAEGAGKLTSSQAPATVCIADVVAEHVDWLWKGRVAFGKLAILDGDPGLGKSTVSLDLAARVTTGTPMPDDTFGVAADTAHTKYGASSSGDKHEPANVLLLCAEDGAADTIRPRLDAAGANLRRVFLLEDIADGGEKRPVSLPLDADAIRAAIIERAAKLVIIDPILAFLPAESNANNGQDVRRALMPLVRIAEETGAAILILRHLNKGGGAGANALYRGGGSMQFAGTARLVLLMTADPDDPERRILAPVKNNLSRFPPSLVFSLQSDHVDSAARVRWEGTSEQTANGLLAAGIAASQPARADREYSQDKAAAFLAEQLAGGVTVATRDLLTRAKAAGIGETALEKAKKAAGLHYSKHKEGDTSLWYCRLPGAFDSEEADTDQLRNSVTPQVLISGYGGENGTFAPSDTSTVCNTKEEKDAGGNSLNVSGSVKDLRSYGVTELMPGGGGDNASVSHLPNTVSVFQNRESDKPAISDMPIVTSATDTDTRRVAFETTSGAYRAVVEEITRRTGVVQFELCVNEQYVGCFDTQAQAVDRWQRFLHSETKNGLLELGKEVDAELGAYFADTGVPTAARRQARK